MQYIHHMRMYHCFRNEAGCPSIFQPISRQRVLLQSPALPSWLDKLTGWIRIALISFPALKSSSLCITDDGLSQLSVRDSAA